MSKPSKKDLEKQALKEYLVPFMNLEKKYPLLPGVKKIESVAAFLGLETDELKSARHFFDNQASEAAQEILKDEEILSLIEKLPFSKNDTIVALGDSLTEDLKGWFEILRHVAEIARPDLDIEWINMGVHEDTSFDTLRRLNRSVLDREPDWVFVMLGTFDAQRLHAASDRTHVSLSEYWENLNSIGFAINEVCENPVVWVTPPPVITELMEKVPLFEGVIFEQDLAQYREVLAGRTGYIVDPRGKRMGSPAEAWNYSPDGLYPSITGHVATVKEVLKTLASGKVIEGSGFDFSEDDDD